MGKRRSQLWIKHHVRSGFEKRIKDTLDVTDGIRFKYEDRRYKYTKSTCQHCGEVVKEGTYTPDFNFYDRVTGEYLFTVEAKGLFDSEDRSKLLAVREANPEIDLRLLFQRDQAIRKGSKTTYSVWATKHKFDFHFGDRLPIEWLDKAKGIPNVIL